METGANTSVRHLQFTPPPKSAVTIKIYVIHRPA
jgi:hypothetical protein